MIRLHHCRLRRLPNHRRWCNLRNLVFLEDHRLLSVELLLRQHAAIKQLFEIIELVRNNLGFLEDHRLLSVELLLRQHAAIKQLFELLELVRNGS